MPNRSVPLVRVPHEILPAKTPTDAVRTLVAAALAEKLPLVENDANGVERKTIFMPPVLDIKIELLAESHGWSYQNTVASLVTAAMDLIAGQRAAVEASKIDVSMPFLARPGQDIFYRSIMASISANRVCLAEASTGIGKSRAMVAAAIECVKLGKRPVVIAAPTLAILGGSLWTEYERLVEGGLGSSVKARFYPGISEFVDHERLKQYLYETIDLSNSIEPADQAVLDWVLVGGPVMTETPLSKAMSRGGQPLCWLMSDLRDIATQLDPAEFAVSTGKESDDIKKLIAEVRADSKTADIVFCTHAMLARAQQGGWEWFPKPTVLMVDEAHLFESIVSNIHSGRLSLYSLRHSARVMRKAEGLGNGSAAGKLESALNNLIGILRNVDDGRSSGIDVAADAKLVDAFKIFFTKIEGCLSSKKLSTLPKIVEARQSISKLKKAVEGEINAIGRIDFSPDRRFPSVTVGKRSIASTLGVLWKDVEGGVILASATLSTPDEFGNSKFDYVAGLLALPASRLDSPNPVIAPWTRSIPVVHIPGKPDLYCRPGPRERNEVNEADWFSVLAFQIAKVSDDAKGGTMVLLTSYAQITAIRQFMMVVGGTAMEPRLIAQSPNEKFASSEARFRKAHGKGARPILLAVGVAWTGVDLTDKAAAPGKDTLLTDLVIGCLPIGLNRSSTMLARIETQHLYPVIKETLMTLLQGLGRAVRSESATHKNIWILDGRIWSAWNGMKSLQLSAQRLLDKYPNQRRF